MFDNTLDFAANHLNNDVIAHDHASEFPSESWALCAEHGVLGWTLPGQLGGKKYSTLLACQLFEAMGQGCTDNGLTFALGAQKWSVQMPLLHFGSEVQINRYLPEMIRGSTIGSFAITEPGSGSDAFSLATTASKEGNHYVLNGEKVMITLAPVSSVAIVFAVTNASAKQWGISAFLIDTDTPGCTLSANIPKMGLRSVPFGNITFDNCRIPATALLGNEGAGSAIFNYSQSLERCLVLAPQVGAMQRLLDLSVQFAKSRTRSGMAIGKHQAVAHRVSNMQIGLETSRLLLYKNAWMIDQGNANLMETAIAKTQISEAFVSCCHDVIAIHGGAGYLTENELERQARDALGATIYGGTVDIQRNIISGLLGL